MQNIYSGSLIINKIVIVGMLLLLWSKSNETCTVKF